MWLVTEVGFFNIVCSDDDDIKGLLTVKARSKQDLVKLEDYIPFTLPIEESDRHDYRFRRKALRRDVSAGIRQLVRGIDYPKTKPAISKLNPDRDDIYLAVWSDLYAIQERET